MVSAKAIFPVVVALFSSAAVLQGCGGGGDKPTPGPTPPPGYGKTVAGAAEAIPELSTLVTALTRADPAVLTLLDQRFSPTHDAPVTVFAPTNDAFSELPKGLFTYLLNTKDKLTTVLEYHVKKGRFLRISENPGKMTDGEKVTMMAGGDVTIHVIKIDTKTSVKVDDGSKNATVTTPNVEADNGIVHIIDKVLVPPGFNPTDFNIVNTAVAAKLNTLAKAVTAADLTDTLSSAGPFTVFAPTDAAFSALGETLTKLLKPENKAALAQVLKYHVAIGELLASDLTDGQKITTVEGKDVEINIIDKKVSVGPAHVTTPDVFATNGVVHVIDKVLIPPGFVPPSSSIEATAATEQKATKAVVV